MDTRCHQSHTGSTRHPQQSPILRRGHRRSWFIAIPLLCLVVSGCQNEFDPRAPFQEQLAVFSVLSTDRPTQYVRVHRTYRPPGYNPITYTEDNFLADAVVTIRESNKSFRLRDTAFVRTDSSHYTFPLRTYYVDPLLPLRGRTYEVFIQSPTRGQINAATTVPDPPRIDIAPEQIQILDRPNLFIQDTRITFIVHLSSATKGYICRLWLYYDVLKNNEWVEERVEVPLTSGDEVHYTLEAAQYPTMTAAPGNSQVGLIYRNGYYKAVINVLNSQYKSTRVIFKWATLVVLQADQNLFKYYRAVHGSEDPYSIRLDEPMFSTIEGGFGVVGSYALDSVVNILPENFWGNR